MDEWRARELVIEEALQMEIKSTLAQKNPYYVQFCALSDEVKKVKLTVTYDTVRQKRLPGRRYYSSIGHALIIDRISKGTIGVVLYSNKFQKCDAGDKRVEYEEEQECFKTLREALKV